MNERPSARAHGLSDVRRKRAALAAGVTGVFALSIGFLLRDPLSVALPVTAAFAFFAMPAWVGAGPRFPMPSALRTAGEGLRDMGLPIAGVTMLFVVLSKGDFSFLALAPFVLIGLVSYHAYRWRYLSAALARVRGEETAMPMRARLWRHYLGYGTGLVGGLLVVWLGRDFEVFARNTLFDYAAFLAAFTLLKTAIDMALPQPPLTPAPVSEVAAQLAAMSPVLFGLPWGLLFAALLLTGEQSDAPSEWFINDATLVVAYTAAATIAVFTAIALVALVLEAATGER